MKQVSKKQDQKPFVDVFKRFKTFDCSKAARKGAVSNLQNNDIGRKVFKISGAVSATNYVNIPDPDTNVKQLGLDGDYVYLEFFAYQKHQFNIHLDFTIAGYEPNIRFTISNRFDSYKKTSGNVLQIPYPKTATEKWTIMGIDIPYHLENFGLFESTNITNFQGIHLMKSIQICSHILVRGIYTSDNQYKISTLPKDMNFKIPPKGAKWSDVYQICYFPEQMDPDFMREMEKKGLPNAEELQKQAFQNADPIIAQSLTEMKKTVEKPINEQQIEQQVQQQQQQFQETNTADNQDNFVKRNFQYAAEKPQKKAPEGLQPYPIVQLSHTIGFSGRYCPDIKWSRTQDSPNELIYASGSVIVSSEVATGNQRFFVGHSAPIACIDLSKDGRIIASAQEGNRSIVKLWDYCENQNIISFNAQYENIKCLSFSYNSKLLCTVGTDNKNREIIRIWDISGVEQGQKPTIFASQVSDFNIVSIKFSPISEKKGDEPLYQLVSCGKENIRFWRINNGHLPAQTVVLNHHARNTVFTVLDFEFSYHEPCAARQSQEIQRVLVGSKTGLLYQVDYSTRQLENVFKCHDDAVCSLVTSAGFCVTGSADQYLRVWPLDFSEYMIIAKHEGIIHSLDVSQDALMVACGTSTGGLGILDLSNSNYKTFLRSHTDEIIKMVYHNYSGYLITLSTDLTIRVWDVQKYEQVYEFTYPPEDYCTTIAAHNTSNVFAAGFSSGTFRIFDIENTRIVEECRYHNATIQALEYTNNGQHLVIGDSSCYYSIYDVNRSYQPIKSFETELPSEYQSISLSNDGNYIATIGDSGTHVNVYDGQTFIQYLKIFCPNTTIRQIKFAQNSAELFVITTDSKIKVFALQLTPEGAEAYFLRELGCTHRDLCTDIAHTDNFKYLVTVGGDSLLKIWDYEFQLKGPGSNQIMLSHVNKISNAVFLPGSNKLFTAGGFEGIYEWDFLGDLTPQERQVDVEGLTPQAAKIPKKKKLIKPSLTHSKVSQELKMEFSDEDIEQEQQLNIERQRQSFSQPAGQYQQQEQLPTFQDQQQGQQEQYNPQQEPQQFVSQLPVPEQQGEQEFPVTESDLDERLDGFDENMINQSQSKKAQDILSNMSMQFTKNIEATRFHPVTVPQDFENQIIDYKKQSRKRDKHRKKQVYQPNEIRKQHKLPFRQYYNDQISEKVANKITRIKDNMESFQLDYALGYNNDSHDNVIWNYMKGWYAYSVENIIIIEHLEKDRQQKVIQLPEHISCMTLSKDFKYIVVGSATKNEKDIANIYVIEANKHNIVNKLGFHTRGVQAIQFNESGKYLVSIGNFKECTVCVWDWPSGKLLSSSYTMDKINDIKISNKAFSYDRIFEFVTVGRDQVQFWALNKDNKLEYYDIFIEKRPDDEDYPEATSVDYIQHKDNYYALVGLTTGELLIYEYGSFKLHSRHKVAAGELVTIQANNLIKRVVITSIDGSLYFWDTNKLSEEFYPSFIKLQFPSSPIAVSLEPTYNEGIAGCIDGGLFYFNIGNQFQSMIQSTINTGKDYQMKFLESDLFYTAHNDGKLRIWSYKTGEEIMGYNFKSQVTATIYIPNHQKLICFFQNNNEVKELNLQKFTTSETFVESQYVEADRKAHVYPVQAFEAILGGKQGKFYLTNNGNLYTLEQVIVNKKNTYRAQKVLELQGVQDIQHYNEKSIIIVATSNGKISAMMVDYDSEREIPYGFTQIDDYDIYENPHGSAIDVNKEQQTITQELYRDTKAETKFVISKVNNGCYYATNTTLQYLFIRNYQKRSVVNRIPLSDFPLFPVLYENRERKWIHIPLQDGNIEQINTDDKEDRQLFQGMLDGPVQNLISRRNQNQIIASTKNGICVYRL